MKKGHYHPGVRDPSNACVQPLRRGRNKAHRLKIPLVESWLFSNVISILFTCASSFLHGLSKVLLS